jgi:hypothetical protein
LTNKNYIKFPDDDKDMIGFTDKVYNSIFEISRSIINNAQPYKILSMSETLNNNNSNNDTFFLMMTDLNIVRGFVFMDMVTAE